MQVNQALIFFYLSGNTAGEAVSPVECRVGLIHFDGLRLRWCKQIALISGGGGVSTIDGM